MSIIRTGMRCVLAMAGTALVASAASAASFQNGSFENGSTPAPGGASGLNNGSTAMTGWTVVAPSGVNLQWQNNGHDGLIASDGVYSLDLTGTNDAGYSGIEQIFDTIAGHSYSLSFDVGASKSYTSAGGATVAAFINGASLFSFNNGDTVSTYSWATASGLFTATGATTKLGLFGTAGGDFTGLDNVKITDLGIATSGVPEPATWAMMTFGFGAIGAGLRRRRSAVNRLSLAL